MRNTTICILLLMVMVSARSVWGADRWWDTNSSVGLQAGNGNWNTEPSGKNWNTFTPANGEQPVTWFNVGDSATFETSGTSAVTVSGTVEVNGITFNGTGYTVGGTELTLTGPSITANVTGTINAPLGGTVGLTKLGSGALILGGINTYSGTTSVSAGSLVLSSGASIANSANLSVSSGALLDVSAVSGGFTLGATQTLSGGGTVHGAVSTASGATIAPGSSAGQLTFAGAGDITLSNGSVVEMELGAPTTPGTTYDQIVVTHSAAKTFTPGTATLRLIGLAGIQTGQTYTLVSAQDSATVASSSYFRNLNGTVMDNEATTYSQNGLSFTINYESTFVSISVSAVPEPGTMAGLILLAPALLVRRKRAA